MSTAGIALAQAAAQSSAPLQGHLWHVLEALAFFVFTIAGITITEAVQKRRSGSDQDHDRDPARFFDTDTPIDTGDADAGHRGGGQRPLGGVATLARDRTEAATDQLTEADAMARPRRQVLLPVMAIASAAAAAVHFAVMPEHYEEAFVYGFFFTVLAIAQLGYAGWLLARPRTSLLVAGAWSSLAVVVLWVVTRTIGIPLGPAAGRTEAFGPLDTLASGFEAVVATASIALLVRRRALRSCPRPSSWSRWLWAAAPLTLASVVITRRGLSAELTRTMPRRWGCVVLATLADAANRYGSAPPLARSDHGSGRHDR